MSLSSPGQDSYAHVSCQTCPEALYNRNTSFSHAQESSIKTETGTKWKTTIEEVEDEESTPSGHFQEQPHQEQKRPEPFSSLWVLTRLRELATEAGIGMLKQWVHSQKQREVNKNLIQLLLNVPTNVALDWLEDLHEPKQFVFRTTRRTDQELNLQIKPQDLEKGTTYQTQALLDSGCMGSCISQQFAEEKKLSLHKWEHPISAYNTDGTENNNGKITHYAEMKMIMDGHSKIRKFAVTNLRRPDVFLGHEWLNYHNPEVDWTTGSLQFTRCPMMCGYMETEDIEDGDRIWMKHPKPPGNI